MGMVFIRTTPVAIWPSLLISTILKHIVQGTTALITIPRTHGIIGAGNLPIHRLRALIRQLIITSSKLLRSVFKPRNSSTPFIVIRDSIIWMTFSFTFNFFFFFFLINYSYSYLRNVFNSSSSSSLFDSFSMW